MKIAEVMTRDPEWIDPEATIEEAACLMRGLDTGFLPDRDITIRAVAEGLDAATAPVEYVMTPSVIYCYEDQDIQRAADLMAENQVRRLLVLDRDKKLAGVVSLGDLCLRCGDHEMAGDVLDDISHVPVSAS
jgi:CBS domain-containing protein